MWKKREGKNEFANSTKFIEQKYLVVGKKHTSHSTIEMYIEMYWWFPPVHIVTITSSFSRTLCDFLSFVWWYYRLLNAHILKTNDHLKTAQCTVQCTIIYYYVLLGTKWIKTLALFWWKNASFLNEKLFFSVHLFSFGLLYMVKWYKQKKFFFFNKFDHLDLFHI